MLLVVGVFKAAERIGFRPPRRIYKNLDYFQDIVGERLDMLQGIDARKLESMYGLFREGHDSVLLDRQPPAFGRRVPVAIQGRRDIAIGVKVISPHRSVTGRTKNLEQWPP